MGNKKVCMKLDLTDIVTYLKNGNKNHSISNDSVFLGMNPGGNIIFKCTFDQWIIQGRKLFMLMTSVKIAPL